MKVRMGGRSVEVRRTLADKVVGYFNPRAGLERLKSRTLLAFAGGYEGGRRDRRHTRKWRPREQSANSDILPDLPDLRARSRDLVRNNPIATGALATTVTNVVGDGLVLQSQIDREVLGLTETQAEDWQRQAEREWELFCSTCDFTSHQSFYELQALIFRSVLESGDVLLVRRFREDPGAAHGTKVQLVEAERLCNRDRQPDTDRRVAGVRFDADGRSIGFEVASRHPDDRMVAGSGFDWTNVPARDSATGRTIAFLLFERLRPDQARGVPYLAPVVEALKELGDYTDHEARAALISAMFTVFVKQGPVAEGEPPVVGSDSDEAVVDPSKEIALEEAGAIIELSDQQEIQVANPSRPNTAFDGFVLALCRQVGVALELPYEVLVKHFTASYSASRAALETAWQFFRKRRSWLAWRLCQPIYEWAIEESVARGRLAAPGFFDDPLKREAWLGADWIGPARINLDPLKEANADKVDIDLGTKTRAQVIMERTGGSYQRKLEQRKREQRDAAGLGGQEAAGAPGANAAPEDDADDEAADVPERGDEA